MSDHVPLSFQHVYDENMNGEDGSKIPGEGDYLVLCSEWEEGLKVTEGYFVEVHRRLGLEAKGLLSSFEIVPTKSFSRMLVDVTLYPAESDYILLDKKISLGIMDP